MCLGFDVSGVVNGTCSRCLLHKNENELLYFYFLKVSHLRQAWLVVRSKYSNRSSVLLNVIKMMKDGHWTVPTYKKALFLKGSGNLKW